MSFAADSVVEPTAGSQSSDWLMIGRVDTTRETDFVEAVQSALGLRAKTVASVDFYVDVEPDSEFLRVALPDETKFRVATRVGGVDDAYLVATGPGVRVRGLERRRPEAHPGLLTRPVVTPVRLRAQRGQRLFQRHPSLP